jgi:hypothetical protein
LQDGKLNDPRKGAEIMMKSRAAGSPSTPAFFATLVVLALAVPATALGQAQFEIQLNLPAVLPPLVEVQPGVRVVRDLDEEVFFVDGRYWVRRDERWYSARSPRGRWAYVESRRAPDSLTRMPPGLFRHWRGRPADLPDRLPPLATVQPGVRVVPDFDEEVFQARGYYWMRRDEHWFRARNHRGNWAYVEPRRVPPELVQNQPGQYRRWRGNEGERYGRGGEMDHGRRDRHDEDRGNR